MALFRAFFKVRHLSDQLAISQRLLSGNLPYARQRSHPTSWTSSSPIAAGQGAQTDRQVSAIVIQSA
jgi:hypothetical protein